VLFAGEEEMLQVYRDTGSFLTSSSTDLPAEIIWMDLLNPTKEEKDLVESRAHVRIPSVEALSEIESSSRLAVDRGTIYLSTPVVAQGDTPDAFLSPLGLILTRQVLVTVRFEELSVVGSVAALIQSNERFAPAQGCSRLFWKR
jgi:magnesium transporter